MQSHKGNRGHLFYHMAISSAVTLSWFVMMWSIDFKPFLVDLVTIWTILSFSRIVIYDLLTNIYLSTSMLVPPDKKIGPSQEERTLHRILSNLSINTFLCSQDWDDVPTQQESHCSCFWLLFPARDLKWLNWWKKRFYHTLYSNDSLRETPTPCSRFCSWFLFSFLFVYLTFGLSS